MWLLLWKEFKCDVTNPIHDMWNRIKLFMITSLCIFAPLYAYIEIIGMGDGNYLHAIGNTLYFIEVVALTIGFGDLSPKTPLGKLTFCVYGIHAVYMGAAILSSVSATRSHIYELRKRGKLIVNTHSRHILIFLQAHDFTSRKNETIRLLHEFQIHPMFSNNPIVLVNTSSAEDHAALVDMIQITPFTVPVHHYFSSIDNEVTFGDQFLSKIGIDDCKVCLILEHTNQCASMLLSTAILSRPGFIPANLHVENTFTSHRQQLKQMGVGGAYLTNRHYPEFIVCAMATHGADDFLTEIVSSTDNTLFSFTLSANHPKKWGTLIQKLFSTPEFEGVPIGFYRHDNTTTINPSPQDDLVGLRSIICIVNNSRVTYDTLSHTISTIVW